MPKNKMSDLRNHLFETLEALKDEEKPMDPKRANAISAIAGQLIESAKAEIRYMEVMGELTEGEFFDGEGDGLAMAASSRRVRRGLGRGV